MYEYPPILHGTVQEQVTQIRDYLARLAQEKNKDVMEPGGSLDSGELDRLRKQIAGHEQALEQATAEIERLKRQLRNQ